MAPHRHQGPVQQHRHVRLRHLGRPESEALTTDGAGPAIESEDVEGNVSFAVYDNNDNNQMINRTDGKGVANAADTVFDTRGQVIETISRLAVADTNKAAYNPNSNLLTQADAECGVMKYEYNPRTRAWMNCWICEVVTDSMQSAPIGRSLHR
ncbi:MAG: hypothetical protein AAGI37_13970 [Planctomycetota bacterium]